MRIILLLKIMEYKYFKCYYCHYHNNFIIPKRSKGKCCKNCGTFNYFNFKRKNRNYTTNNLNRSFSRLENNYSRNQNESLYNNNSQNPNGSLYNNFIFFNFLKTNSAFRANIFFCSFLFGQPIIFI